ncbi:phytanoyl-CoA dioxygenase family protein [Paenibacillus aestuarii]|uniref:Phytanoyl-CoA dioxygenase family protein n=1 Tax=Paenibacillus aestuarii TaxID=516965 RepID=A0ABW0KER9_9BACL|nr:phytanoyl-CoA dioxygenase family protein [Paenibacillus aestuarii]
MVNQEQIEFFKQNGFVQIDNIISPQELEELRGFMDEIMDSNHANSIQTDKRGGTYYRVLNQRVNTWRDHAGMARYMSHPRFSKAALQLTGAQGIRLFHDHALLKMPEDSKETPWHQDLPYWPMNENGALSIWIALDDVDESNGCMMFIPRSRQAGKLNAISLTEPQDIFEYVKGTDVENEKPVICRMKAGSCTFHDGLCFHYAYPNYSQKPRRALAIIYMPDGTTYSGKPHVLTDDLGLQADQPIRGNMFPLLARG